MARAGDRRRTQINGQFAPHTIAMIASPAYQALSLAARHVLDRLEIELASHGGKHNGLLPCTYADFVRFKIDRQSIPPALRELQALGLVEITKGRTTSPDLRAPNWYRLTYRPTDTDPSTDEWKRIGDNANDIARTARRTLKGGRRENLRPGWKPPPV